MRYQIFYITLQSIYFTLNFDVARVYIFIDTFGTWKLQFYVLEKSLKSPWILSLQFAMNPVLTLMTYGPLQDAKCSAIRITGTTPAWCHTRAWAEAACDWCCQMLSNWQTADVCPLSAAKHQQLNIFITVLVLCNHWYGNCIFAINLFAAH